MKGSNSCKGMNSCKGSKGTVGQGGGKGQGSTTAGSGFNSPKTWKSKHTPNNSGKGNGFQTSK